MLSSVCSGVRSFSSTWRRHGANRPEPPEGQGTVYWHALMGQTILGKFDGFHLTPPEWLRMTILVAGSTKEIA